jgi:hypothetical protein
MSAAEVIALADAERTAPERREEWRAGFDSGVKAGTTRYFNSPVMETIAVELTLLRTLYAAVCDELEQRDKVLAVVNRIKCQALARVIELARELDRRSPGWDR